MVGESERKILSRLIIKLDCVCVEVGGGQDLMALFLVPT